MLGEEDDCAHCRTACYWCGCCAEAFTDADTRAMRDARRQTQSAVTYVRPVPVHLSTNATAKDSQSSYYAPSFASTAPSGSFATDR